MTSISRVATPEGVEALAKPWEDLLAAQPDADVFLGARFLGCWIDHFRADAEPRLVALEQAGEIRALAPLVLRHERWARLPVRVLGFPVPADSGFARAGFVTGARPEETIPLLLAHLAREDRGWDVLSLAGFRDDSPQLAIIEREAARLGFSVSPRTPIGTARVMEAPPDWEAFLHARRHFRKSLHDERRRLERTGTPTFRVYRDATEIDAGIAATEHVLLRRLGVAQLDAAPPADARMLRFTFDVARRSAATREVEIRILAVDDQPVAFLVSWIRDGIAYPFVTKYDPAFEQASPGRAVFADFIRDASAQGYRAIDFLSDWSYLHRFTPDTIHHVSLTLFPPRVRSRVARFAQERVVPWRRRQGERRRGADGGD